MSIDESTSLASEGDSSVSDAGLDIGNAYSNEASSHKRWISLLSPHNIGALYVLVLIVVVFAIIAPDAFLSGITVTQILNDSAITGIAGLALLIPLCCGTFDLSIGYVMTLSGVVSAHFIASTNSGVVVACVVALLIAMAIGIINGIVVVIMRVDSFIGTLATGLIVSSFVIMVTSDQTIASVRLTGPFAKISQTSIHGVELPVFYALAIGAILWFVLEHMVVGRRFYAVGFNSDAARLGGIGVERLRFISLIVSSTLAGVAGIVLASSLSVGSPSAGDNYLLPAFAVAFLGATQLRPGRFNAPGTLLGVLMLTTGTTGLALAASPQWGQDLFTGVVLIVALAMTGAERRDSGSPRRPIKDRVGERVSVLWK